MRSRAKIERVEQQIEGDSIVTRIRIRNKLTKQLIIGSYIIGISDKHIKIQGKSPTHSPV